MSETIEVSGNRFELIDESRYEDDKVFLRAEPIDDTPEQFERRFKQDSEPDDLLISEGDTKEEAVEEIRKTINMLYDPVINTPNRSVSVNNIGNTVVMNETEKQNIHVINKIYEQLSNKGHGVTYLSNHQSNIHEAMNRTLQHRNRDIVYINHNNIGVNVNLFHPNYNEMDSSKKIKHADIIRSFIMKHTEIDTEEWMAGTFEDTQKNLFDLIYDNIGNPDGFRNNVLETSNETIEKIVSNVPEPAVERVLTGETSFTPEDLVNDNYIVMAGRESPTRYTTHIQKFLTLCMTNVDMDDHTIIIQGMPDEVLRSDIITRLFDSDVNILFSADPRFDRTEVEQSDSIDEIINI